MDEMSDYPPLLWDEIPMDAWTEPFWAAAAERQLRFPRCGDCDRFRWPPSPFCPACHSQRVEWACAGTPRLYSYTVIRRAAAATGESKLWVPALVEFAEGDGIRLVTAVVDAPIASLSIGAELAVVWWETDKATVPLFRPAGDPTEERLADQGIL